MTDAQTDDAIMAVGPGDAQQAGPLRPCDPCQGTPVSSPGETEHNEFAEMVELAARDHRVTGLRFSLEQARSGAYALLGPVFLFAVTALFGIFSPTLDSLGDFRLVAIVSYLSASAGFLFLFIWARRDPLVASLVGLVVFSILALPSLIIMAINVWYIDLMVLLGLIDAVRAAFHHRRILRRALRQADTVAGDSGPTRCST